jgi:uncharacterized protein (DUF4415 family)
MSTKPDAAVAELVTMAAMPDAAVDTSDIPEMEDWSRAERGRFYRPVKQAVTIRLDADVVAWSRRREAQYQTAINRLLREHMLRHR